MEVADEGSNAGEVMCVEGSRGLLRLGLDVYRNTKDRKSVVFL